MPGTTNAVARKDAHGSAADCPDSEDWTRGCALKTSPGWKAKRIEEWKPTSKMPKSRGTHFKCYMILRRTREQKKYLKWSVARNCPKFITDTKLWKKKKKQSTSGRRSVKILLLDVFKPWEKWKSKEAEGGQRAKGGAVESLPRGLKEDWALRN